MKKITHNLDIHGNAYLFDGCRWVFQGEVRNGNEILMRINTGESFETQEECIEHAKEYCIRYAESISEKVSKIKGVKSVITDFSPVNDEIL